MSSLSTSLISSHIILLFLFLFPSFVCAQDSPSDLSFEPRVITDKVPATQKITDRKIEDRLLKVLKASDKFKSLKVKSQEGIVTISGEAITPEDREFAIDITKKMEGVIYVDSDMEVARPERVLDMDSLLSSVDSLKSEFWARLPRLILGALFLIIGIIFSKLAAAFLRPIFEKRYRNGFLAGLVSKALISPFIIIILYLALQVTGLTKLAVTVLTGTGLMGLAIGIAFRNIAENFFASVLLSVQRPYEIGDLIQIDEHLGYVRQLTSRGTTLMTLDGNHVQIPNALAYTQILTNFTANKNMRQSFTVGVGFDCALGRAQDIAKKIALDHPKVLKKPAPFVLVESLGAATVNLGVYFWLDTTQYSQFKVKSSMIRLVKNAFEKHQISMPDEAREIVFPEGVPLTKEESGSHKELSPAESEPLLGEGDFESEFQEIQEQSNNSRTLEGGENLLES